MNNNVRRRQRRRAYKMAYFMPVCLLLLLLAFLSGLGIILPKNPGISLLALTGIGVLYVVMERLSNNLTKGE